MTMELAPTQSFVGNKCHCSECLHRIDENNILAAVFWIKNMNNHNGLLSHGMKKRRLPINSIFITLI